MSQNQDTLSVELEIKDDKAEVLLSRSKQKLDDFVKTAEKAQPHIKFKIDDPFAGKLTTDFDALSKRVEETRRRFSEIAKVRLDGGSIGNLSREILTAQNHSRQLAADIVNIKKELASPNRTSSITFLTASLRAAEEEADRLSRKLNSLPSNIAQGGLIGRGATNNLKLSGFQKQNLSYQINDVLTGLASGQNPTQILAQQGGQVAQIFSKEQIVGFTAAYGGLVSILGAGTIAIAATYKITGDLRAEAERRLKYENEISGAINRQILGQREALENQTKMREAAQNQFEFSQRLQNNKSDELRRERDNLLAQNNLLPRSNPVLENGKIVQKPNADFEQNLRRIIELEDQIRQNSLTASRQADAAFNQRNENFKKSQLDSIEFERKRAEEFAKAEKKRLEDVEKAKEKVKELQRVYLDTFSNLSSKLNSNNPFVSIFTDADKALKDLKQNIKGLPPELQKVAVEMQKKINFRQLLEAQTGNQLSSFDLREQANQFRNPFDPDKQKKDQQEFVERFLRNNPNYLYLQGKNSLDEETRSKILKQFAPSALTETPADRLNKSLEEKYILLYKPGQTLEQQKISDRQFIAATNGANPLDLNKSLRESAAFVREREAARQDKYQTDALDVYRKQLAIQEKIEANTKAQNKTAESGGTKALDITLKDQTSGGAAQLQQSATATDTAAAYSGLSVYEEYDIRQTLRGKR